MITYQLAIYFDITMRLLVKCNVFVIEFNVEQSDMFNSSFFFYCLFLSSNLFLIYFQAKYRISVQAYFSNKPKYMNNHIG